MNRAYDRKGKLRTREEGKKRRGKQHGKGKKVQNKANKGLGRRCRERNSCAEERKRGSDNMSGCVTGGGEMAV